MLQIKKKYINNLVTTVISLRWMTNPSEGLVFLDGSSSKNFTTFKLDRVPHGLKFPNFCFQWHQNDGPTTGLSRGSHREVKRYVIAYVLDNSIGLNQENYYFQCVGKLE